MNPSVDMTAILNILYKFNLEPICAYCFLTQFWIRTPKFCANSSNVRNLIKEGDREKNEQKRQTSISISLLSSSMFILIFLQRSCFRSLVLLFLLLNFLQSEEICIKTFIYTNIFLCWPYRYFWSKLPWICSCFFTIINVM